ncbi:hypothetical protein ABOM_006769 [Aspergillus bombycis]|uniref:Fungal N-terminal domain-containing protein n=1 Tax=Aspergillus bombycis TaxID=109264 RepID=A0A1F7ZYL1_9EURO|nr:hypothetical protein ABOM_006769 [Aspergillus bombycis]OGM44534.1 hypothetical protein ABOM_006769 [Aspergillus bombycis]
MEAVGAASAILSIATAGVQCSVRLISFAAQIKTAPERITHIAEDVSLNTSILQQVGELIKQSADGGELPGCPENEGGQEQHSRIAGEGTKPTEAKQGVFSAAGLATTMKIATKCEGIFSVLDDLLHKASRQLSQGPGKTVQVKLSRVQRLKWPFLQPEMDTIRNELKDARGTLTLMLQVAIANWQSQPNTVIIPYSREDLAWLKRSIVAIRKTQTLESNPQKESLSTSVASFELNTCQFPDVPATTNSKGSEAMFDNTDHESASNPKTRERSIFDPIPDPDGKLLELFTSSHRQQECTQTGATSEPAGPSSATLTVHLFTPQASIQDNEIQVNHRYHTANLSSKEIKSQLDAWKYSTPSSICEQLQVLTLKERVALDTNNLIFHTTPYPWHKPKLEWIHFGEYVPVIEGLETPKARALTVITSSETPGLPSPRDHGPHWTMGKQDKPVPRPQPALRPKLKAELEDIDDTIAATGAGSAVAVGVARSATSLNIETEEENEEEEDQNDHLSENDWEVENVVQGLLAAYTT